MINIYNDLAQKYGYLTVKDFPKYEKLEYKKNKLKLDIDILSNCKQLGMYLKFLVFKQTHFIFNNKFYNQIDGVAMGSPLAPVFPNIFIDFHEAKWLNEYNLNKPKFYLRYVDDILGFFQEGTRFIKFSNFFKLEEF